MRRLIIALVFSASLRADFSYQESSQMTGGVVFDMLKLGGPLTRGAREAQISTVAVSGNRMVTTRKDAATVIDLDKETITEINLGKKQYSTVTFTQIRAAMQKALADVQKRKKDKEPNVEMKFKVSAKATGKSKSITGVNAKEVRIAMEMEGRDKESGQMGATAILNDTWMATVAGYNEVKAFETRMGQKLGANFRPGMEAQMLAQPEMVQGMAEAAREMAKVDGAPVENVLRMGGSMADLTAAADAPPTAEKPESKSSGAAAALRGFGIGRKKEEQPEEKEAAKPAMLMEMLLQRSQFSTAAVDAVKFEVPAGFKEVQSEIAKRAK